MNKTVSYLKFLLKTRIASPLRSLFISLICEKPNITGWENRILIINLEALGDLVVFTSVLKHYKKRFPEKKIYLLIKAGIGIETIFKGTFVDEVITLDYRKFFINPFYGASFINSLRKIGFHKIINHDFSAAEISGKWIAVGVGAAEVIGYEGIGVEFEQPFDSHQKKNLHVVMEKIYPRYTRIIPSIDATAGRVQEFPSALRHYIAIYEGATGFREEDYSTSLPFPKDSATKVFKPLEKERYAILGIAASVSYKRWPMEKFADVARFFKTRNLKAVITGSLAEKPLLDRFESMLAGEVINKGGKTTLKELLMLIKDSACVVTNDTSLVHLAIAFKVPSVCVTGGGHFGMFSNYGYPGINRWVYKKSPCFGDNGRCGKRLPPDTPSPCLAPIEVKDVIREIDAALSAREKNSSPESKDFRLGPVGEITTLSVRNEGTKIKVIYAGIQSENYNPKRYPSFEYSNFYLSLKEMKDVSVIEYPYDPIIGMGKRTFNKKLLHLIRREKPDIFFAFMFTDELDHAVLDEIKKTTTSIAWFADDHWRLWNYSRQYAPHFTKAVTTWSGAPKIYRSLGIVNVIRSQWATNTQIWKPIVAKKDIDASFVGQYNPARGKIIKKLREAGIDVYVRGWGWPEGRASHAELLDIVSRSKINLNISVPPSRFTPKSLGRLLLKRSLDTIDVSLSIIDNFRSWRNMGIPQIKARPFEILACRAFLISSFADDVDAYYADGKEIVYYTGGTDDLVEKIQHYLGNDEKREKIAAAGYERTLRDHTYEKRFKEIFKIVGITYE